MIAGMPNTLCCSWHMHAGAEMLSRSAAVGTPTCVRLELQTEKVSVF